MHTGVNMKLGSRFRSYEPLDFRYLPTPWIYSALLEDSLESKQTVHTYQRHGSLGNMDSNDVFQIMKKYAENCIITTLEGSVQRRLYYNDNTIIEVNVDKKRRGENSCTIKVASIDSKLVAELIKWGRKYLTVNQSSLVYAVGQGSSGLTLQELGKIQDKLMTDNYDVTVAEKADHVIEQINSSNPQGRLTIINGEPGCHRKGQPILMYDGTVKAVEDIKIGDQLMGPDSKPRNVLQLRRNKEEMIKIIPNKGDSWVVNKNHVLTLQCRTSQQQWTTVDVDILTYMQWSKQKQHHAKLMRTSVEFPNQDDLNIHPYLLGYLLGDGSLTQSTPTITNLPSELHDDINDQIKLFDLCIKERQYGNKCPTYSLKRIQHQRWPNPLSLELHNLNLKVACENKFIPQMYKTASRANRLEILAGILDADGSCDNQKGFDITLKSEQLIDDICFVSRSLGLAAYKKECFKSSQNHTINKYYRCYISGNVEIIPTKLQHKKCLPRKQIKSVLRTGFQLIETNTVENYYGFTLDEDGRYLLGDFTVTHNTGKTHLIKGIIPKIKDAIVILLPTRLIAEVDGPALVSLLAEWKCDYGYASDVENPAIVLILEDADDCLTTRNEANMSVVSSMLNHTDGIFGSMLDIRIIATTNASQIEFDKAFTRPGRLCAHITIDKLSPEHASEVYTRVSDGKKKRYKKPATLAQVYADANNNPYGYIEEEKRLGFKTNE